MAALDNAIQQLAQASSSQSVDPYVGLDAIKKLSASGEELRIFIDNSEGGGHQTTTMNILKRLIDYGFKAPVTIYYDKPETLESSLPAYRRGMKEMPYRGVRLTFVGKRTTAETPARLLICGGSDANVKRLEQRYKDMKCAFYLQLQPWGWKASDYLLHRGFPGEPPMVVKLNGQETLGKSRFTFSAYSQPEPERDQQVWDEYKANPRFTSVVTLAEQVDQRRDQIWTLPAYGVKSWKYFINLVLAAAKAQALMPSKGLQVKPVVLLSFGALLEEEDDLEDNPHQGALLAQALEGTWSKLDGTPPLKQYIKGNLAGRCRVLYGEDSKNFVEVLQSLPSNGILILSMKTAPQEVFNYMYASATLPPVFEGRGTLNLMLNLGRPYLCRTHSSSGSHPDNRADYPAFGLDDNPPPIGMEMRNLAACTESSLLQYNQPDTKQLPWPSSKLGHGLIRMLTDETTKWYFTALKEVYGNRGNDRLLKALRYCAGEQGFLP